MKITYLTSLLAFFLVFSCQPKTPNESAEEEVDFTSYPIDIRAKSVEFTDQIESIELLGFEESSESSLKGDEVFLKYEEGFIIVNESIGTVFLFSQDGTFKSKFNHKGQGPEEYRYMQHTGYRDGLIETYVYETQKMMQYDLEGNFIQSLELPYPASHVLYFDNGYLLGMGNEVGLDSIDHDIVFADNQMKAYAFALPFDKPNGVPMAGPDNEFRVDGDRVLFNPFWTDSVYQINNGKVSPYIHFDFGEDWLWDELALSRDFKTTMIQGKVWGYTWVMGKDRIEINYMRDLELPPGIGYIDRKTKEFFHYRYDWSERQRFPFMPLRFEEGKLLAVFLADELGEVLESVDQENVVVKGFLSKEQILQSENPVLVWVKFK